MILKMIFDLDSNVVDNDYRYSIVSFLKNGLYKNNANEASKLYNNNIMKAMTFSAYFPNGRMSSKEIIVDDKKMTLYLSTPDAKLFMLLYNSSIIKLNKPYPLKNVMMTLKSVNIIQNRVIDKSTVVIRFLSPLLIRKHLSNNKDLYLDVRNEESNSLINANLQSLASYMDMTVGEVKITPYKSKKTVIRNGGLYYHANLGTYILEGDRSAINLLYQAGMGSKRSLGFGMFEVLS